MSEPLSDILTASLQELSVVAAGETPDDVALSDSMKVLNRLIDAWAASGLTIPSVTRTEGAIVSGTQVYTVGSGGTINIPWPCEIIRVNYEDDNVTPNIERQLKEHTDDSWSGVAMKDFQSPYPTTWYIDGNFPLANLSFWPVPTKNNLKWVIYAGTPVSEFSAVTDTLTLKPSYRRMIVKNLAVELAPSYGVKLQPGDLLLQQAEDSLRTLKALNLGMSDLAVDSGALVQGSGGKGRFNIFTGM